MGSISSLPTQVHPTCPALSPHLSQGWNSGPTSPRPRIDVAKAAMREHLSWVRRAGLLPIPSLTLCMTLNRPHPPPLTCFPNSSMRRFHQRTTWLPCTPVVPDLGFCAGWSHQGLWKQRKQCLLMMVSIWEVRKEKTTSDWL